MNYTYSLLANEHELVQSTTLQHGIAYFFLTIQIMKHSHVMLLNNETGEVMLEHIPDEDSFGKLFVSSSIEEV